MERILRGLPAPTTSEKCPWCGSTITHAKFLQIQAAIREDERKKLAEAERMLRTSLQKEVAAQQQKLQKERQAIDAERGRINKLIDNVRQQEEKRRKKEIADVRQILQKDRDAALLKKDAEFARERAAMEKKIADMSRRVKKAGGDLGEGAELDLYEELRGAFSDDQIARVKGRPGLILHDVRYKGKSSGKILIDSTPRAAWQHAFVTKLRQAQTELAADHAILSTPAFPTGKRELFIESGVIVVAPARVRPMVEVLRKALIAMDVAKMSDAERADKLNRLFRFMTSSGFKRKLAEASDLANEALEIDVQEKRAHDTVWKKRGTVLTRIKHVLREIDTDVSAIVEARDDDDEPPAPVQLRPAAYRVTQK
ncbi:MAG TPA: DUF2130 domain-containing protein [Thermoanaerobaculia bacterium]|nr:DUF2130 domain-containing protein [Thermoanaerobaculia bacterium]